MFRVFGHHGVFILDGGLPKWRTAGYDVKSIASRYDDEILKTNPATDAIEKHYQGLSVWFSLGCKITVFTKKHI